MESPRFKEIHKEFVLSSCLCNVHQPILLHAEELFAADVYCHEKEALWTKHYAGVCSGWLLP